MKIQKLLHYIIPIHDGNFKEFALKGTYETAAGFFKPHGIQFHPLKPGELLEL